MADDLQDLLSNYQDLSLEELGSSLLARQSAQKKAARKAAKKRQNRQNMMMLAAAGVGIFNKFANQRAKEIEERQDWIKLNAEAEYNQLQPLAEMMSQIGDYDSFEELRNNTADYETAKTAIYPIIEAGIPKQIKEEGGGRLTRIENSAADAILSKMIDEGYRKDFANTLRSLNEGNANIDVQELFSRYAGYTPAAYTAERVGLYDKAMKDARRSGSILNVDNYKNLLNMVGAKFETKGGYNIFEKVTDEDIRGPGIDEIFDVVSIKKHFVPLINEQVGLSAKKDYVSDVYSTDEGQRQMTALKTYGTFTTGDIYYKRQVSKYDKEFVFKSDLDEILGEMNNNITDDIYADATALSERLKDDRNFAQDFYLGRAYERAKEEGISSDNPNYGRIIQSYTAQFAEDMLQDDISRYRISLASVLRAGVQRVPSTYGRGLFSLGIGLNQDIIYNSSQVQFLLKPTFTFDKSAGEFRAEDIFLNANKDKKQALAYLQFAGIDSSTLSPQQKDNVKNIFFDSVQPYFEISREAFDKGYDMWYNNWNKRYTNNSLFNNVARGLFIGEQLVERGQSLKDVKIGE